MTPSASSSSKPLSLTRHEAWRVLVTVMAGENPLFAKHYDTAALAESILDQARAAEVELTALREALQTAEQQRDEAQRCWSEVNDIVAKLTRERIKGCRRLRLGTR